MADSSHFDQLNQAINQTTNFHVYIYTLKNYEKIFPLHFDTLTVLFL
jgi:hypothetical protein